MHILDSVLPYTTRQSHGESNPGHLAENQTFLPLNYGTKHPDTVSASGAGLATPLNVLLPDGPEEDALPQRFELRLSG